MAPIDPYILLYVLAGIILVVVLWVIFRPKKSASANTFSTPSMADNYKNSSSLTQRIRSFFGQNRKQTFSEWIDMAIVQHAEHLSPVQEYQLKQLSQWLNQTSKQEANYFVKSLETFCKANTLEMGWASGGKADARLIEETQKTLLFESFSLWQARQTQALALYYYWKSNPKSKKNRPYMQKLYQNLSIKGWITQPTDILFAKDSARLTYMIEAIQLAAQNHPTDFESILKETAGVPNIAEQPSSLLTPDSDGAAEQQPVALEDEVQ